MLNENRGADQTVHPCILICTIDVYCLDCVLEILVFITCALINSLCTLDNLNPKTVFCLVLCFMSQSTIFQSCWDMVFQG